jgi:hypothetical protein
LTSLSFGLQLVRDLYVQPDYRLFFGLSLIWGFGSMIVIAITLIFGEGHHLIVRRTITILVAIDAVALYSLSSFSGVTNSYSLPAGIKYLKKHLGTERFYTLGPIAPNYGAYYRIASINHNYLPVAQNWVNYLKERIDPWLDPVCFTGNFARNEANAPSQADVLCDNLSAYAEVGVRYIVTAHGQNPFQAISTLAVMDSGRKPLVLDNGQSVRGEISGADFMGNGINAVSVLIGNYNGQSDGLLKIQVCANGVCAFGERNLKESRDNQPFRIQLNQPITFSTGELEYTISHAAGRIPVAIWISRPKNAQQTHRSESIPDGAAPQLQFFHVRAASQIASDISLPEWQAWYGWNVGKTIDANGQAQTIGQTISPDQLLQAFRSGKISWTGPGSPAQTEGQPRVFESSDMDIYEIPGTKPYFETVEGRCDLRAENRSTLSVNCASDSKLIRRELFYPGWTASVGGTNVKIEAYDGIFQAIKVPPGKYTITFTYTPTNWPVILTLFLLGAVLVIIDLVRSLQGLSKGKQGAPDR